MSTHYRAAGVNLEAADRTVAAIREVVRSTHGPEVLAGVGAFGGMFDASGLPQDAVLVASTDGVGTKVALALAWGRPEGVGVDLVNHCVNDILVHGARPLFFLDYIACARLDPETVARVVRGMAAACRAVGCALLGGETAEMPGVYAEGQMDVVGTVVGVVSRERRLPRPDIGPGDVLIGLAASGPHTNGYSLIRKVIAGLPPETRLPDGQTLADTLLAPHRCYLDAVNRLREHVPVKALAHITGGGLPGNVPRVLPPGCGVRIWRHAWPVPPVFRFLQERGGIPDEEMFRVFNMGIGMVAIVPANATDRALALLEGQAWVIGEVVEGKGVTLA